MRTHNFFCIRISLTLAALVLSFQVARAQTPDTVVGDYRGYLTTPQELATIKNNADRGIEPYKSAVSEVISAARSRWSFSLEEVASCGGADDPRWIDNDGGTKVVYSKALAYHLTGDRDYANEVKQILEDVMASVLEISSKKRQCQLNFGWGTPEFVAGADLIEEYWKGMTCRGPLSTRHGDNQLGGGDCKRLFQNWLVKNPYYIVSTTHGINNWGTAAAVTTGYIADYLWDRTDVELVHRNPSYINGGKSFLFSPAEAYQHTKSHLLDSMNGYAVSYGSSRSCDLMSESPDQDPALGPPIKSQITENGILPADARRQEKCNIQTYNGQYQNYPQINLDNLIAYCELLHRRGDTSCFDNIDYSDVPNFRFQDKRGRSWVTHLRPGRGSLERAIDAIITDANTVWKREGGLTVAYRYYRKNKRSPQTASKWERFIVKRGTGHCSQSICFGDLTHGFGAGEDPGPPPTVPPPGGDIGKAPPPPPPPPPMPHPPLNLRVEIIRESTPKPPPTDPGSVRLTDDTRVSSSRPTKNYGDDSFLRVRKSSEEWSSLLKFEVSGIQTSIDSAKVRLHITDESDSAGSIFLTSNNLKGSLQPWREENLTWENAPELSSSLLDSAGSAVVGGWIEFDVSSVVRGNGTYSFRLTGNSGNSVLFSSKEGNQAPRLVVN